MKKYFHLLLASTLLLLSSCAHLMHLDRAQSTFNQGAELENKLKFSPQSEVAASPESFYAMAYAEVKNALKQEGQLKEDQLLGNAYTIKALCEWKLKKYDDAVKTADDAVGTFLQMESKGIRMPRDKAVMEALPFIIQIDKSREHFLDLPPPEKSSFADAQSHYLAVIADPDSLDKAGTLIHAINKLENARQNVKHNYELSTYFLLTELAALKAWSDCNGYLSDCIAKGKAFSNTDERKKAVKFFTDQDKAFVTKKDSLLIDLGKILPDGEENVLYKYWKIVM